MKMKSDIQRVHPQIEICRYKKRKHLKKALTKILKLSITLLKKRGQSL